MMLLPACWPYSILFITHNCSCFGLYVFNISTTLYFLIKNPFTRDNLMIFWHYKIHLYPVDFKAALEIYPVFPFFTIILTHNTTASFVDSLTFHFSFNFSCVQSRMSSNSVIVYTRNQQLDFCAYWLLLATFPEVSQSLPRAEEKETAILVVSTGGEIMSLFSF